MYTSSGPELSEHVNPILLTLIHTSSSMLATSSAYGLSGTVAGGLLVACKLICLCFLSTLALQL